MEEEFKAGDIVRDRDGPYFGIVLSPYSIVNSDKKDQGHEIVWISPKNELYTNGAGTTKLKGLHVVGSFDVAKLRKVITDAM